MIPIGLSAFGLLLHFTLSSPSIVLAIFVPHSSSDGLESLLPLHNFTVTGQLLCRIGLDEPKPTAGVVEVWEEDSWNADDLIAQVNASSDGRFAFQFVHHEMGEISPYLWIDHCCVPPSHQSENPCGQVWTHKFSEPPHNSTLNLVVVIEVDTKSTTNSTMPPSGDPKKPKNFAN